ncbi:MAG: hypothetical protein V4773_13590 [Verrucomicrobiota bacterium]
MKFPFLRPAALALLALPLLPAALRAEPYNPALVAADARWVIHADFSSLRTSQLGQELIAIMQKAQLNANNGLIGINVPRLLNTIGTLTAYGTNLVADPAALDGTLVAQGTADLRKIAESMLLQGTLAEPKVFTEITDLPFPAYAISDPKAPEGKKMEVFVAFPPEPIVLVSKSKASLQKAHAVFRGSAPSLAKSADSPIARLARNASGSYLFAASTTPTDAIFPEKGPQARILQLANSGSVALGERGPMLFAHIELSASSDKNAEKLMKILEGLTAMLSLAESNDKQLAEFLKATTVTREKDLVTLKLAYQADQVVKMVHTLAEPPAPRANPQRGPTLTQGKTVAEWTAAETDSEREGLAVRTIENVSLTNGMLINLGRSGGGSFDRLEIVASGGGSPLVFRRDTMRSSRPGILQVAFPGSDDTYTLKVSYSKDTEGKAKYAVSVLDPRDAKKSK